MPIVKVDIAPGVNREGTRYSAEGQWFNGDKIRFRSGRVEKIGGWVKLSSSQYLGVCRSLVNWTTLRGDNYLGVGTNLKYYVENGGVYHDITPVRHTSSPLAPDPISTAFGELASSITPSTTTIPLVDASSFPGQNGLIRIGSELMRYSAVSGNSLVGVVRGVNGSTAATHASGADVECATVMVADNNHGAAPGDFLTMSGASAFAGLTAGELNREHQVTWVKDSTAYAIELNEFPTSATSGGGAAVDVEYQVNTGLDVYVTGLGWGADPWGSGGWGDPAQVGIGQQLRLWSAANYGEDLVFGPRNGPVFYWDATLGLSVRGQYLSDLSTANGFQGQFVPHTAGMVATTPVERFIVLLGANPYDPTDPNTAFDPMLVRWSDQDNPFEWADAYTNQAGSFRLTHGSYIVTAKPTRQEVLIWTDSALYSMQYLGGDYVWGFHQLSDNISIISPNAVATANNVTYWMGADKFYIYTGRVETLPCSLRQYVFEDLNQSQGYQVFCGTIERYNEVWWFYCSAGSSVVNKYVVYNYAENVWFHGTMNRTAWLDSSLRDYPLAADYNNRILYHEVGTDDVSGFSPVPIHAYIESSDFDIIDGDRIAYVRRMLPDINFIGSVVNNPSVKVKLMPRANSGSAYMSSRTEDVDSKDSFAFQRVYDVQQFDGQVSVRVRGRQLSMRVESDAAGVAWQLGSMRFDLKPDGRR